MDIRDRALSVLKDEMSKNTLEHIEKIEYLEEWIIDAMVNFHKRELLEPITSEHSAIEVWVYTQQQKACDLMGDTGNLSYTTEERNWNIENFWFGYYRALEDFEIIFLSKNLNPCKDIVIPKGITLDIPFGNKNIRFTDLNAEQASCLLHLSEDSDILNRRTGTTALKKETEEEESEIIG